MLNAIFNRQPPQDSSMFSAIFNRESLVISFYLFLQAGFICVSETSLLSVSTATSASGILTAIGCCLLFNFIADLPGMASAKKLEITEQRAIQKYVEKFTEAHQNKPILNTDNEFKGKQEAWLLDRSSQTIRNALGVMHNGGGLALSIISSFGALATQSSLAGLIPGYIVSIGCMLLAVKYFNRNMPQLLEKNGNDQTEHLVALQSGWDSITLGNRNNLRSWQELFRQTLEKSRISSVKLLMEMRTAELATRFVISLPVLANIIYMVNENHHNPKLLTALAISLPIQMNLFPKICAVSSYFSLWNKMEVDIDLMEKSLKAPTNLLNENYRPETRIQWNRLRLSVQDVPQAINSFPELQSFLTNSTARRVTLRGHNGAGKSTIAALLKGNYGDNATYFPSNSRLVFNSTYRRNFSTGQKIQAELQEIMQIQDPDMHDRNHLLILDEWNANLDSEATARISSLIDRASQNFRIFEILHRTDNNSLHSVDVKNQDEIRQSSSASQSQHFQYIEGTQANMTERLRTSLMSNELENAMNLPSQAEIRAYVQEQGIPLSVHGRQRQAFSRTVETKVEYEETPEAQRTLRFSPRSASSEHKSNRDQTTETQALESEDNFLRTENSAFAPLDQSGIRQRLKTFESSGK